MNRSFFSLLPRLSLFLALLLSLAGCHHAVTDPTAPNFIVAEGKGLSITRADLDDAVKDALSEQNLTAEQVGPAKMPMVQSMVLDHLIFNQLMLNKAGEIPDSEVKKTSDEALEKMNQNYKMQFNSDTALVNKLKEHGHDLDWLKKRIHEQVVITKVMEKEIPAQGNPTEEKIEAFYNANPDKFVMAEKIRASRILIQVEPNAPPAVQAEAKKKIEAANDRLKKGEDFSKVAQSVSQDAYSAPRGGDVGTFGKGEQPGYDVLFSYKVGQVSPIFATPFGWEIAKVTEIHPGGKLTLAEVRDKLTDYLHQHDQAEQAEVYRKKLMADAGVIYHIKPADLPATSGKPGPS